MIPVEPALFQVGPDGSESPMSDLQRKYRRREYPDRPISDIKDMRCVFLMLLIKEMRAAGNECFNLSIEHAVFVLMQLDDPGLGYEFYLSLLGPESERVGMDMGALLDAGWATRGHCRDGLTLKVTEEGRSFMEECPVTIERCRASVEKTVRIAGPKSNVELMMLATAMLLIKGEEGKNRTPDEIVDLYLRVRAMVDRATVEKTVEESMALLSERAVEQKVLA